MKDANSVVQAAVTKTASFDGAGFDLVKRAPLQGFFVVVTYSGALQTSGDGTCTFSVEHSSDNSTFYAHSSGAADVITLTTTAQDGEIFIPVMTDKRYIRLVYTSGGTPVGDTITYSGHIVLTRP